MASSARLKINRCHSQHMHRGVFKATNQNDSSLSNGMQFQDDQLYIADSDISSMSNLPVNLHSKPKAACNFQLSSTFARLPFNSQKQTFLSQKARNYSIQTSLELGKVQNNEREGETQESNNTEQLSLSNQPEASQLIQNSQSLQLNVQNLACQQQQILAEQIQNLLLYQSTQSKWLDSHIKNQEPFKIHSSNYLTPTQSFQQLPNSSNKHDFNIPNKPSRQREQESQKEPQITATLTLNQGSTNNKPPNQFMPTDRVTKAPSSIRRVNSNSFYSTHFPKKQPQMLQKSQQIHIPVSGLADIIFPSSSSSSSHALSKSSPSSDKLREPQLLIETPISSSTGQSSSSTAWSSLKFKESGQNKNKIALCTKELFCSIDSMVTKQNSSKNKINALSSKSSSTNRNVERRKQVGSLRYISTSSSPNKQRCLSSDYFPSTQRVQSQQQERLMSASQDHSLEKNQNKQDFSQSQESSEQLRRNQLELKLFRQNTSEGIRKTHNLELGNQCESKEDIIRIGQPKQQIKRDHGLVRQRFQRQTSSIVMKGQKHPFEQKRWSASPAVNYETNRPLTQQINQRQLQKQQQILNSQGKQIQSNQYETPQSILSAQCKQQQKGNKHDQSESLFSNDFLKQIMSRRIINLPCSSSSSQQLCGKSRQ